MIRVSLETVVVADDEELMEIFDATDLLRQGVSERVLQALPGHRDARSTRLADEALVAAIRPRCGSDVDPAANQGEQQPEKSG